MNSSLMHRNRFDSGGVSLSYLDSGPGASATAPVIVALHALWMQAQSFGALAARLFPDFRVVALDQRGHGHSDHAKDYSRAAFVEDVGRLLNHLKLDGPVIVLGNSLGGTNAFQFAARHPARVSHLIIEEAPAVEDAVFEWMKPWSGTFADRAAFAKAAGPLFWSLEPSLVDVHGGVRLRLSIEDLMQIQRDTNGDWWKDWTATTCPALVIRGTSSKAVDAGIMEAMASRRANTRIVALDAGHVMHEDAVAATAREIRAFLDDKKT